MHKLGRSGSGAGMGGRRAEGAKRMRNAEGTHSKVIDVALVRSKAKSAATSDVAKAEKKILKENDCNDNAQLCAMAACCNPQPSDRSKAYMH